MFMLPKTGSKVNIFLKLSLKVIDCDGKRYSTTKLESKARFKRRELYFEVKIHSN